MSTKDAHLRYSRAPLGVGDRKRCNLREGSEVTGDGTWTGMLCVAPRCHSPGFLLIRWWTSFLCLVLLPCHSLKSSRANHPSTEILSQKQSFPPCKLISQAFFAVTKLRGEVSASSFVPTSSGLQFGISLAKTTLLRVTGNKTHQIECTASDE